MVCLQQLLGVLFAVFMLLPQRKQPLLHRFVCRSLISLQLLVGDKANLQVH